MNNVLLSELLEHFDLTHRSFLHDLVIVRLLKLFDRHYNNIDKVSLAKWYQLTDIACLLVHSHEDFSICSLAHDALQLILLHSFHDDNGTI